MYILHIKVLMLREGGGVQQEERGRLGSKVLSRAEMDFLPEPLYTHVVYFNYPVKKLLDRAATVVTLEGLDLRAALAPS